MEISCTGHDPCYRPGRTHDLCDSCACVWESGGALVVMVVMMQQVDVDLMATMHDDDGDGSPSSLLVDRCGDGDVVVGGDWSS